jgi:hypothetical protein
MRKNVIYAIVLLTMFAFSILLVPEVLSETGNVKVVSYSWYIDTAGLLEVVGEVQNVGTSTVNSVMLNGIVTTTDGAQLQGGALVYVAQLLPQQKAPFYMTFMQSLNSNMQSSVIPTVSSVDLTVTSAPTTTSYQYQDLKITKHSDSLDATTENRGTYWVTGTLQNTGSQTAQNIRVLGTFYDSKGNVLAVGGYTDRDPLIVSLAPSKTVDFKFGAYDMNETSAPSDQKIASYSLLIQTEGPLLQGSGPQITPYPQNPQSSTSPTSGTSPTTSTSPSDTQTATSNPTDSSSVTNSASPPNWLYPAIIVIALVAIIGAVTLVLKKRKPPQEEQ